MRADACSGSSRIIVSYFIRAINVLLPGYFDRDIREFGISGFSEQADMCSIRGVTDPGTECFCIVNIKNDDLVFADQRYVVVF
jgi:hypothetical protein